MVVVCGGGGGGVCVSFGVFFFFAMMFNEKICDKTLENSFLLNPVFHII